MANNPYAAVPRAGERGQALFETAWLLPIVLLSLALMCFSAKFAVVTENAESAVRYANTVNFTKSTFLRLSLYSLYDGASEISHTVPQRICDVGDVADLLQTETVSFVDQKLQGRHKIWSAPDTTVSCASGSLVFPSGTLARSLVLNYQAPTLVSSITPVFGRVLFGQDTISGITSRSPALLSTVSNRNLVACYGTLRTALQGSLIHGALGTADNDPPASVSIADLQEPPPSSAQPEQAESATCGG